MLTGHLMCIDYFQQGFTNFACIFEPYTKYCAEQVLCQNYCKDLNRNNAVFTSYLAWCESQKECNRLDSFSIINLTFQFDFPIANMLILCLFAFRLRLADILVRPMQRLTKYNLLLSAIRKHITEESEAEIMDLMVSKSNEKSFLLSAITIQIVGEREGHFFSPSQLLYILIMFSYFNS
jgi:pleckstrin homology domain-containing family G member 5